MTSAFIYTDAYLDYDYGPMYPLRVIRRIKDLAPRWVVLGGGGYEISNVARAWALAWAVMNGVEPDEQLPSAYLELASKYEVHGQRLRGSPPQPPIVMAEPAGKSGWRWRGSSIIVSLGEKNPRLKAKTLVCTLCAGRFDSQPSFLDFPS